MPKVVFFLEERSAKELLKVLLPRMFPESPVQFIYKVYEGKIDLRENITRDIKAFSNEADTRFIILQDQDLSNCEELKRKLKELCSKWLDRMFIRIACKELESWYIAQLSAVERAFKVRGLAAQQEKVKFRYPDRLGTPDRQLAALLKTKNAIYSKINGSRLIGEYLDPNSTRSPSFKHFIAAVRKSV